MTEDQMREAFEAWMSNNGEWPQAVESGRDGYKLMQTASAWNVWQACAASQAQEIEALREIAETKTVARQRIMEECNALTAEVDGLTEQLRALRAQVQDQALHLISAHAQAEEAHADAELYRYLRAQHEGEHAQAFCVFCPGVVNGLDPVGSMPGELDAAIRAAMKESHDRP